MDKSKLEALVIQLQDAKFRQQFSSQLYQVKEILKDNLARFKLEENLDEELIPDSLNIFRILRNSCANCINNQNTILELEIIGIISKYIEQFQKLDKKDLHKIFVPLTQFLGNFTSGNEQSQKEFWSTFYPQYFETLMESKEAKSLSALTMVLYNCLNQEQMLNELLCTVKGQDLLTKIFNFFMTPTPPDNLDSTWIFLCVDQHFLMHEKFLKLVLQDFALESKLIFLEHILNLTEENLSISDNFKPFEVMAIDFSHGFCQMAQNILHLNCNNPEEDPVVFFMMLKILCNLSARADEISRKLQDTEVLKYCIEMVTNLKQIHDQLQSTLQFKQHLIQIIGNLCYRHRSNQDHVRESGIIPVIMDSCGINDKHSPYLEQWAILALRNLCENNTDNQKEISYLEKVGLADNSFLNEIGISVSETSDGKFQLKFKNKP